MGLPMTPYMCLGQNLSLNFKADPLGHRMSVITGSIILFRQGLSLPVD